MKRKLENLLSADIPAAYALTGEEKYQLLELVKDSVKADLERTGNADPKNVGLTYLWYMQYFSFNAGFELGRRAERNRAKRARSKAKQS